MKASPAVASELAQALAQYSDGIVQEAVFLLCSERPGLQHALLELLNTNIAHRYIGTIKSFFPEKFHGFIASEKIMQEYGQDVFLSVDEIGTFSVGSIVSFSVVLNAKGQPQARKLDFAAPPPPPPAQVSQKRSLPDIDSDFPMKASRRDAGTGPRRAIWQQQAWASQNDSAANPPPADRRFSGVIKSFYAEKHHGFILCDQLFHEYGCDVFVSSMEIKSFIEGDAVSFTIALNKDGKPQAHELAPGNGLDPDRFTGTIKSFFPEKHHGFITCDVLFREYGCDVFLSSMEIQNFKEGDVVTFKIALNKDGKPQARELEGLGF